MPTTATGQDRASSAARASLAEFFGGWRGDAILAVLTGAVMIGLIGTGGLLEPAETTVAEAASRLAAGQGSWTLPRGAEALSEVTRAPLAEWLAAAGLSIAGPSTAGARWVAASTTYLLLLISLLLVRRSASTLVAGLWAAGTVLTPAFILRAGQAGSTGVAMGATALAVALLASGRATERATSWVRAAGLGLASGLATLAGGPAVAMVHLLALSGWLLIGDEHPRGAPENRARSVAAAMLAVAGLGLVAWGLWSGRAGWPSAASLLLLFLADDGAPSAARAWAGVGVLLVALGVWRFDALRRSRSIATLLVGVAVAAPWYVALARAPEAGEIGATLTAALDTPWSSNGAVGDALRRIAYGLYPLLALLPLAVSRVLGAARSPTKRLGTLLILWSALAFAASLTGAASLEIEPVATCLLGALCALGLAFEPRHEGDPRADRAAIATGGMLFIVTARDLDHDPTLLSALALPPSARADLAGSDLPVLIGLGVLAGLILLAVATLRVPATCSPKTGRALGRARWIALLVILVTLLGGAGVTMRRALGDAAASASWADVYSLYERTAGPGDALYGWQEAGTGGRFFVGRAPVTLSFARDLRRVLSRASGRVFFVTRTIYYSQLSEMLSRMTGARPRPLNVRRDHHVLALFEMPETGFRDGTTSRIDVVPEHARRDPAGLGTGAIRVVGAELATTRACPGDTIDLRLYLESVRPLAEDLRLRVTLRAERGNAPRAQADHDPTDDGFPTSLWSPGDLILDQVQFVVPPDLEAGRYTITAEVAGGGAGRVELGRVNIERSDP